jgi:hypothetical protein
MDLVVQSIPISDLFPFQSGDAACNLGVSISWIWSSMNPGAWTAPVQALGLASALLALFSNMAISKTSQGANQVDDFNMVGVLCSRNVQ